MGKRNVFLKRVLVGLVVLLGLLPSVWGQGGRSWALKAGPGGIVTGHAVVEGEVFLGGRWSVALRAAVIHPNADSLRGPAEGFFVKAGPKMYLSKESASDLRGLYLKPEAVVGHYRDWETNVRGNRGNRWVNTFGGTVNAGYNLLLWDRVLVEGSVGVGYVAQYESLLVYNDQPPFEAWKLPYELVSGDERGGYEHSQWSVKGGLCLNGGLLLGIKF